MPSVWCSWTRWAPTSRWRRFTLGRAAGGGRARRRRATGANWGKNVTLLASITRRGAGPRLAVEGATTREVFEAYLERVLAPTPRPGRTVVMDNLSSHKGGRVREIVGAAGCGLLHLPPYSPPYSPDLNPIEQAFSKVEGLLRRAEARSRESPIEAMGRALEAVSARDARGFFGHRGYRSMGQLL